MSDHPHHILHVYSPIVVHNQLPYDIVFANTNKIAAGERLNLFDTNPTTNYQAHVSSIIPDTTEITDDSVQVQ